MSARLAPAVVAVVLLTWFSGRMPDACAAENAPGAISTAQIEADWIRQEQVRWLPPSPRNRPEGASGNVTPAQDAAGGVDGVKDGKFGFHTGEQDSPWWQVDLGRIVPIDRVLIFNRCDGNVEHRAGRLQVLASDDAKTWRPLYKHDGSIFRGQADQKPLTVPGQGAKARYLRIELPGRQYLHLDEVEVYAVGNAENAALRRPAVQSSVSEWSRSHGEPSPAETVAAAPEVPLSIETAVARGRKLADDLKPMGVDVSNETAALNEIATAASQLPGDAAPAVRRGLFLKAKGVVRQLALRNPLLDFDDLVLVKRAPGTFTHMSDQNYGWFSRPGGGLYVLEGWKGPAPKLRQLAAGLPEGSVLSPDLSYDGKSLLFSHCRYYPGLREHPNKLDKSNVPEDAFYHVYRINVDGSGLVRLTRGKYDDFDARWLPNGEIVFLSTRRGQSIQVGKVSGAECIEGAAGDSYVRCGGGPERPVAVYTLHVMNVGGGDIRQISPFEMFEWTPAVDRDGRILYARWDYVDRWNMPFMSLWSTLPDGTSAQAVFKNYTQNPHCAFEARPIPGSNKLIFTASGHHSNTGGSLVLLDRNIAADGDGPMKRLTPEVCFPETEGWPQSYFINPYPLSENHYLVAWSDQEMIGWPGPAEPVNATGIYLFDAFGNLNLIYRDPAISSMSPLPLRPRARPPATASQQVAWEGEQEGRMLLLDVYQGIESTPRGAVRRLRIVGVPVKTHPTMNFPAIGVTHDDPGKVVLGTVPVEADGSAYFRVPSGVALFFQALDGEGKAVQTMRSATYVQPGQSSTCVGCHEMRNTAPANAFPMAVAREPSKIRPGPAGSWPLDYAALVQPVLESQCVRCHKPGTEGAKVDLTAARSYEALLHYGRPSLREHVQAAYMAGYSVPGAGAAQSNPLVALLQKGHYDVKLDAAGWDRLYTWMDTYGQRQGSFSADQENRLRSLRQAMAAMLEPQ